MLTFGPGTHGLDGTGRVDDTDALLALLPKSRFLHGLPGRYLHRQSLTLSGHHLTLDPDAYLLPRFPPEATVRTAVLLTGTDSRLIGGRIHGGRLRRTIGARITYRSVGARIRLTKFTHFGSLNDNWGHAGEGIWVDRGTDITRPDESARDFLVEDIEAANCSRNGIAWIGGHGTFRRCNVHNIGGKLGPDSIFESDYGSYHAGDNATGIENTPGAGIDIEPSGPAETGPPTYQLSGSVIDCTFRSSWVGALVPSRDFGGPVNCLGNDIRYNRWLGRYIFDQAPVTWRSRPGPGSDE